MRCGKLRMWCSVVVVLAAGMTAFAQEQETDPAPAGTMAVYQTAMGGGYGRVLARSSPVMTRSDLKRYAVILELTGEQSEAAQALLDGYAAQAGAFRQHFVEAQQRLSERIKEEDPEQFNWLGAMRELYLTSGRRKAELDEAFLQDLRALLPPAQDGKWEAFEILLRRHRLMRLGMLAGERADVIAIVERQGLAADARLRAVLDTYADELDRALVNREKVQQESLQRSTQMKYDGSEADGETVRRMTADVLGASLRVRDINRKYARQVQEFLDGPEAARFAEAFEQASFPELHRPTLADRALQAAAALADLDDRQRQGTQELAAKFAQEVRGVNERLAKALDEAEANFKPQDVPYDPYGLKPLRQERQALVDATYSQLRQILRPEQIERIPEPDPKPAARVR